MIFYSFYVLNIVPKIYFPQKDMIEKFFHCIGIESNMFELISDRETHCFGEYEGFELNFVKVSHVQNIPAYGFILEEKNKRIYYSGDSNDIPENIVKMFMDGDLEYIYQDTCGLDYDGNAHLSFEKLCEKIPCDYRSRVICIHHDNYLDIKQVKEKGFKLPDQLCPVINEPYESFE